MDDPEVRTLQKKIARTKKDLRDWEHTFQKKHGRPPTVKDIAERPQVEKFYKKYNQLKKEFKQKTEPVEPPKKNSVEFVRSPTNGQLRSQPTMFDSKSERVGKKLFDSQPAPSPHLNRPLAEDEAFWLGVSSSQPPPMPLEQKPKRLVLGNSQPLTKRKKVPQFGRNPFQRSDSQSSVTSTSSTQPLASPATQLAQPLSQLLLEEEEEEEEAEPIDIINHDVNPFMQYDPACFQWDDPDFFIGPGFFNRVQGAIPLLKDQSRLERVMYKLEKGTLGEVSQENKLMEMDVDQDVLEFIQTNRTVDPDSFEGAIAPIDEDLLNQREYKKKPLQKRQTKLFKMKFVDTSI